MTIKSINKCRSGFELPMHDWEEEIVNKWRAVANASYYMEENAENISIV